MGIFEENAQAPLHTTIKSDPLRYPHSFDDQTGILFVREIECLFSPLQVGANDVPHRADLGVSKPIFAPITETRLWRNQPFFTDYSGPCVDLRCNVV